MRLSTVLNCSVSVVTIFHAVWAYEDAGRSDELGNDPNFCPFAPRFAPGEERLIPGETKELFELVEQLLERDSQCLEACIGGVRKSQYDRAEIGDALEDCRACVAADEATKRTALRLAMENNVGCAFAAAAEDRCFVTVRTRYRWTKASRSDKSFYDGYWTLPEELQGSQDIVPSKCSECMPTDGAGSIMAFFFTLFSAALESGCTFLSASPEQLGHGLSVEAFNDFFRGSAGCAADSHGALQHVPTVFMRANGSLFAHEDEYLSEEPRLRPGFLYYASRSWVKGQSLSYAMRLSMPVGGIPVCDRKHSALLARFLLRGKLESAQDRRAQMSRRSSAALGKPQGDLAETQIAESAWFDPLRKERSKVVINVVVHVRRGDVVHNLGNNGMYRQHYTPFHVITTALKVLMLSWGPLAEVLGVRFAFYIASEGDVASFPVQDWKRLLSPHELHFRLRPYNGMKSVGLEEAKSVAQNVSALQTLGNMMDADVLLCDGKSLFSLTANLYGLSTEFLSYPWLLNMGEPLDKTIRLKRGNIDAPLPLEKMKTWPRHPAYTALKMIDRQALFHPGVRFLRHVHALPEFREELELLYKYRQRLFLEGLLARVYERKKLAIERGVHFNLGY